MIKRMLFTGVLGFLLAGSVIMLIWKLGHVKPEYSWTAPVGIIVGIVFGIWSAKK